MDKEIRHRHLPRQQKRHGAGKQAQNQQRAARQLQHAARAKQRKQRHRAVPVRHGNGKFKKFRQTVLQKHIARNHAHQAQRRVLPIL